MSAGDLLNAWKANRDAENLVIAATCPCEPRAALFARDLNSPPVAVLDSRDLLRMLRRCPSDSLPVLPRKSAAEGLRRLAARLGSTRFSPKYIPVAAVLLATYLVTGNPFSFFCSMTILGHLGVTLIQRRTGRRLFQEAGSQ